MSLPAPRAKDYTIDYCAIFARKDTATRQIGPVHRSVEAASTIKIPIFIMACERNQQQHHTLNHKLCQLSEHSSNGSGFLEWASKAGDEHTVRELLYFMMAFSDCVATNILIDYVGGKEMINLWLKKQGFKTRLTMQYINFVREDIVESVGMTTAADMCRLFGLLVSSEWHSAYANLAYAATSTLDYSWVGERVSDALPGARGKTGSMMNCAPDQRTFLNVVGSVLYEGEEVGFAIFACGYASSDAALQRLEKTVLKRLIETVKETAAI